ncbi:MAG: hypothetical protein SX243_23495 [Acidobacteriota bacterium]|nr:hypothetical protein [Acidobacteriota bacterium]
MKNGRSGSLSILSPGARRVLRSAAVLAAVGGFLAWGLAGFATGGSDGTLHMEIPRYLGVTESYAIPQPTQVPAVEKTLQEYAAEVAELYEPDAATAAELARLNTLRQIKEYHQDALLAESSIFGLGIVRNVGDTDWELAVLVPQGTPPAAAQTALVNHGVTRDLGDIAYVLEVASPVILDADERPGQSEVWSGEFSQPNGNCPRGSMGWLVQSNRADEENENGESTGAQSIGYLAALHTTSVGPMHRYEFFDQIPRDIQTSAMQSIGCLGFSETGRVLRLGPHTSVLVPQNIRQDIDFVAFNEEGACDQAASPEAADGSQEGVPVCNGFGPIPGPVDPWLMEAPDTDDAATLIFAQSSICGAATADLRTGMLEGLEFIVQVAVTDWSNNPLFTVTLDDLWRISSPNAFGQSGDSGAPVWIFDANANGGEGANRPLGTYVGRFNVGTQTKYFTTSLPNNLKDFDVDLILDNPRNPDEEPCATSCECSCESFLGGLGPEEARLVLDTALAANSNAMKRLTSLAVKHETELRGLQNASGAAFYENLFATELAPLVQEAFSTRERSKLNSTKIKAALEVLAWIHHSVTSQELKDEASRMYRVVAAYGEGRTVLDLLRIYMRYAEEPEGPKGSGRSKLGVAR